MDDIQITEDLLQDLKKGKEYAIDTIVERYQRMLFTFIVRSVGDAHEAEDLLQETFIRVIRNIVNYHEQNRFKSWLFTIAINVIRDYTRKKKVRPVAYAPMNENSSWQFNPVKHCEEKEIAAVLEQALASLPAEQRQVFLLRESAGLSFRDIAQILDIPINTALGRMHYAVKKLQTKLEKIPHV